jgi:hypothetical protein
MWDYNVDKTEKGPQKKLSTGIALLVLNLEIKAH